MGSSPFSNAVETVATLEEVVRRHWFAELLDGREDSVCP